jgi:tRNA(Ile)-lysidine synthase
MGDAAALSGLTERFASIVGASISRLLGLEPGPGVVAVSGGADSVALLRALAESSRGSSVTVAHLNHQLRGPDSDADAAFVSRLCPTLPHCLQSLSVADVAAAAGDNLEAVARRLRYEFLARVARQSGATWVATAHTRDDQAETVLHRLIRGSGLRGLRGIAESRELVPGIRLIRPMLTLSRDDVIAYLREIDQPWREDATNRDTRFTRNRIRHELLPLLRSFNPAIVETLGRTAEQADEIYTQIEEEVAALLLQAESARAARVVILDHGRLQNAPSHLVRELLHRIWGREGWPRGGMTLAHWERAADVARGVALAWDLPGGIRIVAAGRVVRVGPAAQLPP